MKKICSYFCMIALAIGVAACVPVNPSAPIVSSTPTILQQTPAPTDLPDAAQAVAVQSMNAVQQAYLDEIDLSYSLSFAKKLEHISSNETLGYRTAGSQAELDTGERIAQEMKALGLAEVTKDEITLDTWTFKKADLSFQDANDQPYPCVLGGYQTNFDTQGVKQYQLVYAGQGRAEDYAGLDVQGKLVLIDIDQREDWWINYPAYQAHLKGAVGVLAMQTGGYGEISEDALNAQDVCGPADAPAFSISQTDAKALKAALEKSGKNEVTVSLDAKSTVGFDGKSYNVFGTIPGKEADSLMILSAHYDSYFAGFQDDNAAIALMMGIAKAMVDSGYQPQKTLVFCAMAAEEWGMSNTRYDWSTGAYNQIFRARPEWVGKAIANINFEMPAYEHETADEIRTVYEYKPFLESFASTLPKPEGVYSDGLHISAPLRTWSDDYSFSLAGVPAMRNDFQNGEFMKTHYHSQYDNQDTYNEAAFAYHHKLYGLLVLAYDQIAIAPLDFAPRFEALRTSMDKAVIDASGGAAELEGLQAAIDEVLAANAKVSKLVGQLNNLYTAALFAKDEKQVNAVFDQSRQLNSELLKTFKFAQDTLCKLTWEDAEIFPHEHFQKNIRALQDGIDALKEGNVAGAVDDALWLVDNNWYAYAFDKEVFNTFTQYAINQPADRLMWGAGRIQGHVDLFDVIQSLRAKATQTAPDVSAELDVLTQAVAEQQRLLKEAIAQETADIAQMASQLRALQDTEQ